MKSKIISNKQLIAIGLMLFALFFGAGNIIFPPFLGQQAGNNFGFAILGFLITGVGLPLLGIAAIAKTGDLETLANRAGTVFGMIFTIVIYSAIGPFYGIPRTGTVTFEIAVTPFLTLLSESAVKSPWSLAIFTAIFFIITAWLSLNPTKLVDRIGKIITPFMLFVLFILVLKSFITPMGTPVSPAEDYQTAPLFKGFIDGYLTMDTIAALVFGIIVISSIKEMGIKKSSDITKTCIQAAIIAAIGLILVYLSLAYIGASSPEAIGMKANGGGILSAASTHLFGTFGTTILALAITSACLTTSIGLVSSCAQFFSKIIPGLSYKAVVIVISTFSAIIANAGLTQLIAFSIPVLIMIYPLAIVLIVLSFFHDQFNGYSSVYKSALTATGIVSVFDGLAETSIDISPVVDILVYLPLFTKGIGWVVPALVGACIGYLYGKFAKR